MSQRGRGMNHDHGRMAVLHFENEHFKVEDCRPVFPPLTELRPPFHVVPCGRGKIESLAVEAAQAASGILADGQKPNRQVAIEHVGITAARDSAIKFRGGQDVTIESCCIATKDPNGGRLDITTAPIASKVSGSRGSS